MSNTFNMNTDIINSINLWKEEAEEISPTPDSNITYIMKILIRQDLHEETPIEITMKCGRNWPVRILMERLERVFNTPTNSMKFMTSLNNTWTPLDNEKMLKNYHTILQKTDNTIYLSKITQKG